MKQFVKENLCFVVAVSVAGMGCPTETHLLVDALIKCLQSCKDIKRE